MHPENTAIGYTVRGPRLGDYRQCVIGVGDQTIETAFWQQYVVARLVWEQSKLGFEHSLAFVEKVKLVSIDRPIEIRHRLFPAGQKNRHRFLGAGSHRLHD